MKKIIIASTDKEVRSKIKRIVLDCRLDEIKSVSSGSEILREVRSNDDGVIIATPMKDIQISLLCKRIPVSWDIIALIPSGMPEPLESSNLTVCKLPINIRKLRDVLNKLIETSSLKRKQYSTDDAEIIASAKSVLMKQYGFSEGQAHYFLQKKSMETATPVSTIAKGITKNNN